MTVFRSCYSARLGYANVDDTELTVDTTRDNTGAELQRQECYQTTLVSVIAFATDDGDFRLSLKSTRSVSGLSGRSKWLSQAQHWCWTTSPAVVETDADENPDPGEELMKGVC